MVSYGALSLRQVKCLVVDCLGGLRLARRLDLRNRNISSWKQMLIPFLKESSFSSDYPGLIKDLSSSSPPSSIRERNRLVPRPSNLEFEDVLQHPSLMQGLVNSLGVMKSLRLSRFCCLLHKTSGELSRFTKKCLYNLVVAMHKGLLRDSEAARSLAMFRAWDRLQYLITLSERLAGTYQNLRSNIKH
ncbi:hypothetical protein COLO4_28585 [Corchorus olitorius]|uniref:Uncharacterized protein n=1 Tax=Corchorus olitorius TaxID=93759 RepID=A0A1R3HJI2_9ROSI|nr:hypothetical protein COLO4_28585 [Corchorus olitorius]